MHHVADIPLAIVGMSCRLPGADGLDQFWQLLSEGRTDLGELPPDRLDRDLYFDPRKGVRTKSYTTLGGITSDRPFDPNCCPISDELIESSHKVHLKLLDVAVSACRNAGMDPFAMQKRHIGVYTGHTPPSVEIGKMLYGGQVSQTAPLLHEVEGFDQLLGDQSQAVTAEIVQQVRAETAADNKLVKLWSNAYHAPGLISRALGLSGPGMSFDAACASGMRALGHAGRALQLGQIEAAIVGAASCCSVDTLTLFSAAQSVSQHGSRPFDENADGLVAAEGYIILVVKTLAKALADRDPIQAVIRGIGVSSDGKGKSLWAPRWEGQVEAIRRAYGPDISPADLQFIEMHATSTQVGDATEMKALTNALSGVIPAGTKIPVGSVKANVGHTLETAGLASMVKTVLAMQHGVIPPQINIEQLNQKIDWDQAPFYVPLQPLEWQPPGPDRPRRAAVNAFGIGGLNVHVVLDEHVPQASQALVSATPTNGDFDAQRHEPIAIVGRGAILPGARTIEALWDMVHSGRDCRTEASQERWPRTEGETDPEWLTANRTGGFITDFEYDWKKHKVPPKQVSSADPLQFMFLDAADQAFADAGYHEKPVDKMRTGAMVGTIFGAEFGNQLQMGLRLPEFKRTLAQVLRTRGIAEEQIAELAARYEDVLLKHLPALIDETGSFTASTLASRITKTFDLMGGAVAVDAGDASSMAALSASIDLLRAGDCDLMVCASGHRAMDAATFCMIKRSGMLAEGAACNPLDSSSNGMFPGEGVGVVLLKRLSDAERDGDQIHGIIRSIGVSRADALSEALQSAIANGLETARLKPEDVVVIESGAPGMPDVAEEELETLADSYGGESTGLTKQIGTFSGQIGHVGGFSGMASLLKAMGELNHAEMPPNIALNSPVESLTAHKDVLDASTSPTSLLAPKDDGRLIAGINCYSQYKLAYHMLVEGAQRAPVAPKAVQALPAQAPQSHGDIGEWRIVRAGGETLENLAERATDIALHAGDCLAAATGLADSVAQLYPAGSFRMAIVASTADELKTKAALAAKQIANPAARPLLAEKGIFWNLPSERPQVAFLFPGQGSQYAGMFRTLVDNFAPAADAARQVDAVMSALELPTFSSLAWQDGEALGSDVYLTQLSLLAADTIMYAALEAMGLRPDRVAGHSFGELAALVSSGAWSYEQAAQATKARCAAIEGCGAAGVLLSTSASAEVLQQFCDDDEGRVFVSHHNAPDQAVVGGDADAVQRIAARVEVEGHKAVLLDVPAAFHTPLMDGVKQPFASALEDIELDPPRVPLLSSVTNRYVADPADIRNNLVVQMTEPVRYTELVERLVADGASVLVEVGPKQVLTGLHRRILGNDSIPYIGCDHAKRDGLEQLVFVRACVETTGALDGRDDDSLLRLSSAALESDTAAATSEQATWTLIPVGHGGMSVLRVSGSAYDMGFQHGRALSEPIRQVLRRYADLAGTRWDHIVSFEQATANPEAYFGESELEELRGIAAGAGVSESSLIAHNLRLYLEAGAGGAHFAVTSRFTNEGLLHGVNEDLRSAVGVNDCLRRSICVRRPTDRLAHLTFTVPGQVGSLNGINADGLAVTTTALLDLQTQPNCFQGSLVTVLVKQILESARQIEDALEIIRANPGSVPFSLCLSDHASDRLCYVEYDGNTIEVQDSPPQVIGANHRLLGTAGGESPAHSVHRLNRLRELLDTESQQQIDVTRAQQALRDRFDPNRQLEDDAPTLNTVRRVDNQMSVVFQPGQRALWVTSGPSANGHQDDYLRFEFDKLFSDTEALAPEVSTVATRKQQSQDDAEAGAAATKRPTSELTPAQFASAYSEAKAFDTSDVCYRCVVRSVETPAAGDNTFEASGPAVILGHNSAADALHAQLERQGLTVHRLPNVANEDEVLAALDAVWNTAAAPHLFLMTAHDSDAVTTLEQGAWQQRRHLGVTIPYLVTQRWYQLVNEAGLLERATLAAAVTLGGDFGLSGRVRNVESGALCGLLKGVRMELDLTPRKGGQPTSFRIKVIDADTETSDADLASIICRELAIDESEVEVGYFDWKRFVLRPVPERSEDLPPVDAPTVGTIVATGGARGVTACVAKELAMQYGLTLHLIGSSPLPEVPETYHNLSAEELKELRGVIMKEALANGEKRPADAWSRFEKSLEISQTLRSFADAGVKAVYHACDISNRDKLASVLEEVRAADGPITGLLHGAGFEKASRFDKKQPGFVERTLASKVDGAANLMELTLDDPIVCFALFGSVSGRFGGVGQTDYCAANDMLAKLAAWYRQLRPRCRTACFHWHAWDDVGMAVRPESQHIRKLHDIKFMPSAEGSRHLIQELTAGLPEAEVIVTELKEDAAMGLPPAALEQSATQTAAPAAASEQVVGNTAAARLPLVDAVAEKNDDSLTAEVHFDPTKDVFLQQHRFKGRPLLPVVVGIESLIEAALTLDGNSHKSVTVTNLEIQNGLRFLTDDPQTGRLRATAGAGGITSELTADFYNSKGRLLLADRPYLKGVVSFDEESPIRELPTTDAEWADVGYPDDDLVMYHGPIFRYLKDFTGKEETSEAWARITAPEPGEVPGHRGGVGWTVPSAVLDGCFFACGLGLWVVFGGVVAIPQGIDRLRFFRMPRPGETCTLYLHYLGREGDISQFDFSVFGEDGGVLMDVDGYRNVVVAEDTVYAPQILNQDQS